MTTANEPLQTKLRFSRVSKRIARPVYSGRSRDGTDEPQEVSIILPSFPSFPGLDEPSRYLPFPLPPASASPPVGSAVLHERWHSWTLAVISRAIWCMGVGVGLRGWGAGGFSAYRSGRLMASAGGRPGRRSSSSLVAHWSLLYPIIFLSCPVYTKMVFFLNVTIFQTVFIFSRV